MQLVGWSNGICSPVHPVHLMFVAELTVLLRKLYESFVALAGQLQVVHEAVKVNKHMVLFITT